MASSARNVLFTLLLVGVSYGEKVTVKRDNYPENVMPRSPVSSQTFLLGQRKQKVLIESPSKFVHSKTREGLEGLKSFRFLYNVMRKRRSLNNVDERIKIQSHREAQLFPYSSVVKLSIGCTATLIGYKYALTAAHCVHDGKKFTFRIPSIKVGLLHRRGAFHWIRVKKAFIPKQWIKEHVESNGPFVVAKHDYALLELWRPHGRRFMRLSTNPLIPGTRIQFAGFHSDKTSNSMWLSYCKVMQRHGKNDLIFSFCDGEKGVSGSAVIVNSSGKYRAVGIVAGFAISKYKDTVRKFNAANFFTKRKVQQICKWMGIGRNCKYDRIE